MAAPPPAAPAAAAAWQSRGRQQGRRVLNHLADRYLLTDTPWFEQPGF
jgi:hypothetical protein